MTSSEIADFGAVIGARVRTHRVDLGMTRGALAQAASIDISHVARIEQGISNPALGTLIRVAAALGTTASALVEGIGPENLARH